MRLVFCGTPAFALPTLHAVLAAGHSVELILTQPDRASGRGLVEQSSPVKQAALERGIAITQPDKIRNNAELQQQLQAITPDAIVVVAYGRIIPGWMLTLPRLGNLNLHASLLPKYRGAAPIQWAIACGEAETGVTTMKMDAGLDTGDILLQRRLAIAPDQTALELFPVLADVGAALMVETLAGLETETLTATPQDSSLATLAPILQREDGHINCTQSAQEIYNRWRGFQPWPGAYATFRGKKLSIQRMRVVSGGPTGAHTPGTLLLHVKKLLLACGQATWLELLEVQLEGRKQIPAVDFLHGHQLKDGESLT